MSVDQDAAARVAAALGSTGPARWAHLPGRGRGPKQPNPLLRLVVLLRRLIKPVVLLGFFALGVWLCWQFLPQLFSFGDFGVVEQPAAPTPPPVTP